MHPLIRISIIKDDQKSLEKYFSIMPDSFIPTKSGLSPLMLAAQKGSLKTFKYLLEIGQDQTYTNDADKSLKDFLQNDDIIRVHEEFNQSNTQSELPLISWENIQWEPESPIVLKEQNKEDLERVQKLQETLNHAEIVNLDTEWDPSWIDLPTYIDVKKNYLDKPGLQKALRQIFRNQTISTIDLKKLTNNTPELYEPLYIALSCEGIQIDEEANPQKRHPPMKVFDSSAYNDFIDTVNEIVSEEINQKYDSWFLMANQWSNIKKQEIDTPSLFKKANEILTKIHLILLQDISFIIVLLCLYYFPKTELNKTLFDSFLDADGINPEGAMDFDFIPKLSIGKGFFNDEKVYNKQESLKLLNKIKKAQVLSESQKKEVKEFLEKTKPTAGSIEKTCLELSLRKINLEKITQINELLLSLQETRNKIAVNNLGLIYFILKKINRKGVDRNDLFQEGYFALVRAAEKFDITRGAQFSTYAVNWIHQTIIRYRDDHFSTIRFPVHFLTNYVKLERYKKKLEDRMEPLPTDQQIAQDIEVSLNTLETLKNYYRDTVPFHILANEWEEFNDSAIDEPLTNLMNSLPFWYEYDYDYQTMIQQLKQILMDLLNTLPERNVQIMTERFGLDGNKPLTLEELGLFFDVTRERIRQIEAKSLVKLRNPKYHRVLIDFIDWS